MSLTAVLIITAAVLLLAYNQFKINQPTISQVMMAGALNFVLLPFGWGAWSAHLFAPHVLVHWSAWGYMIPLLLGVLAFDLLWKGGRVWFRYPLLWVLIGMVGGFFLWGQGY